MCSLPTAAQPGVALKQRTRWWAFRVVPTASGSSSGGGALCSLLPAHARGPSGREIALIACVIDAPSGPNDEKSENETGGGGPVREPAREPVETRVRARAVAGIRNHDIERVERAGRGFGRRAQVVTVTVVRHLTLSHEAPWLRLGRGRHFSLSHPRFVHTSARASARTGTRDVG